MLEPAIGRLQREGWLVLDTTGLGVDGAVDAIRRHAGLSPSPRGTGAVSPNAAGEPPEDALPRS
jgi:hypothetical protein